MSCSVYKCWHFFYCQLLDNDNNYLCFDDLVRNFNLDPDQELFHDYIKLYLANLGKCWYDF